MLEHSDKCSTKKNGSNEYLLTAAGFLFVRQVAMILWGVGFLTGCLQGLPSKFIQDLTNDKTNVYITFPRMMGKYNY